MKPLHPAFSIIFFSVLILCSQKSKGQRVNVNVNQAIQTMYIKSGFNNKTYQVNLSLPKTYSEQDSLRYPVLYVLDGKFSFNSFCSIRAVYDLGKEIKDIIIVSIDDSAPQMLTGLQAAITILPRQPFRRLIRFGQKS